MDAAEDKITIEPTIEGLHGKAWAVDLQKVRRDQGLTEGEDATVSTWVVEAPWAHPAWHSYALVLVHLRPLKDDRPTKFYLEGATHEVWLYALDPNEPRQPQIETGRLKWLVPLNFAAQFIAKEDAAAELKIGDAVEAITKGTLSPDTDYIRHWAHIFGDNMMKEGAGETKIIINPESDNPQEITIPPHPGPQDHH